MKRFMDFFKRKKTKPNYYLTKDYKGFPLWAIEPPESLQLKDNDNNNQTQTPKEKQDE